MSSSLAPFCRPYTSGAPLGPYGTWDELWNAIEGSDSRWSTRQRASADFEQRLYIDPRHLDFGNEDAGAWKTAARVHLAGDAYDIDDENLTLWVQRATRLTVNASPEPVTKGRTITVTGRITRANWDTHTYQGYAALGAYSSRPPGPPRTRRSRRPPRESRGLSGPR
ncbi:hypothetical protein SBADM41S_08717 [Streptomyces badius]